MNAKLKLISVMTLSAMLSACSMIPEYQRPANPVMLESSESIVDASLAADTGWQEFYQDKQLQQLIALSLENNRNLRATVLQVEQLRAQYKIQRAELLPAVNANASATRQRVPESLNTTGLGGSGVYDEYQIGVGISAWEIDFFGRIDSLQQAALEQFLASEASRKSIQLTLVSEVADAWFSWQATIAQLEFSRSTREAREESYELINKRFESGLASELALRQAETALHEARIAESLYQQQANQNFTALELLVGQTLDRQQWTAKWNDDEHTLQDLPVNLSSEVLLARPDVMQAEHQVKAANANIGAARAAFFPRISLTSSLGLGGSSPSDLTNTGNRLWQISPQLSLPLLDWGVNDANLDVAELQKDINIARYQETIQQAFKEVLDEMQARVTLDAQLTAQQDLTKATGRSLELAEIRYDAGVDSYLEVLDAQRSHIDAQLAQIDTQLARLRNQLTLYKALGGGLKAYSGEVIEQATP
ncbi:efflux transporter outer membrane subunit [Methylophaga sp. SB9B]|uniref:efflux transporter outer membrane subunit n=1 Tax=Methylophaga sp. SB9B TaxID=2570356 RepID=UPI0010A9460A|nr:efflux transporter outer membrane subunit [Methylophaga sp. SB9B]THK41692.1 efflux transporter outer membrane subunit [Methylophaga sp. SB9B]